MWDRCVFRDWKYFRATLYTYAERDIVLPIPSVRPSSDDNVRELIHHNVFTV